MVGRCRVENCLQRGMDGNLQRPSGLLLAQVQDAATDVLAP
jgi:hypothetical protein